MRGITEERLREKFNEFFDDDDYNFEACANSIIAECREFNPRQPIETAPKDRYILLHYSNGIVTQAVWNCIDGKWNTFRSIPAEVNPIHWQESPEDPT